MHSASIFSEEKRAFFIKRCLSTLAGVSIPPSYPFPLGAVLFLLPSAIIGFPMFLHSNYWLSINVSGAAGVLILLLLLKLNRRNIGKTAPLNAPEKGGSSSEGRNIKGKHLIVYLLLMASTYFYFFLTMSFVLEVYANEEVSFGVQIFELVLIHFVTLTSSGSIFFASPKEFATVLPDDNCFNAFSAVFMRPSYVLIVLIIKIAYSAYWYDISVSIVYFALLPLWSLGVIGAILNTLLWGLETINALLFGDGLRGSFISLIVSFVNNCLISIILTITLYHQADRACLIFYLVGSLASLVKSCDLKKIKQNIRNQFEIDFIVMPLLLLCQNFALCLGLFNTFQYKDLYFDNDYQVILIILGGITAFCCLAHWVKGMFLNRMVALRFWKNCYQATEKKEAPNDKLLYRLGAITLPMFLIAITFARSLSLTSEPGKGLLEVWLWSALILRCFNQCWNFHLKLFLLLIEGIIIIGGCSLEPFWIIYFSPLLEIGNGFLLRAGSRTISFVYSLYKLNTTKSLRLANSKRFTCCMLTVCLPFNLLSIFISSLINVPAVGLLGTPMMFLGALRPHRLWPRLSSHLKQDLEAYIYKSLVENLKNLIPELVYKHPDEFQPEDYYILRMGKVLAIFNVVERGFNYIGLNFRGLEMQEPTSCHHVESNSLDDVIKGVVSTDNGRIYRSTFTIMEPLTSIKILSYDDNSFKLTGIIENRDFNQGLKTLYLKLLIYNFQKWSSENPPEFQLFLDEVSLDFSNETDISDLNDIYPIKWFEFLSKSNKVPSLHVKESKVILEVPEEEQPSTENKPKEEIKPPLKVEENDMLMLLDSLENIDAMKSDLQSRQFKPSINADNKQKAVVPAPKAEENLKKPENKFRDVILHFFAISLNQRTKNLEIKINEEQLFKLFKDGGALNTKKWSLGNLLVQKAIKCCEEAIRFSMKIALEIYAIEGCLGEVKDENLKESIEETNQKWFVGNKDSDEIYEAISIKIENLMCLLYDSSKKETNVLRASRTESQGFVMQSMKY